MDKDREIKQGQRLDKVVSLGVIDKSQYKALEEMQEAAGFEFDEIFVISTRKKDRHGDIIEQVWELQNYNQEVKGEISGPVLINHDSRALPVGKGYAWLEDGKLMSGVKFANEIDTYDIGKTVAELVRQNFIKNASVGFIPLEWEKMDDDEDNSGWPSYRFLRNELLEWSVVNVPANPDAQRKMISKGFDLDKLEKAGILEMDEETHKVNDTVKSLQKEIADMREKLEEAQDINEGRKAPLKAYRKYLKLFTELMGLDSLEDEVKSIEQVFGILHDKAKSTDPEETPAGAETQYVLEVSHDSEFGKMAKELAKKN